MTLTAQTGGRRDLAVRMRGENDNVAEVSQRLDGVVDAHGLHVARPGCGRAAVSVHCLSWLSVLPCNGVFVCMYVHKCM
jgi:hypothetical protein